MVITGLERTADDPRVFGSFAEKSDRVGLVANPTSCTSAFVPAAKILAKAAAKTGASLVRLFGPEHGFYGEAQAGAHVPDGIDPETGIPVVSLYGKSARPDKKSLEDLQLLVFDMQDAGLRWYTYLGTLTRIVEAIAGLRDEKKLYPRLLVLDRPNPLSGAILEGPGLDPGFESLVGPRNIPARHGMTLGEYARMIAAESGLSADVLPMEGWSRGMDMAECGLPWIPPSPNLPTMESLRAYAGTCLLEGTNVSEGRGTTRPFEVFGAPWMDGNLIKEAIDSEGIEGLACRPTFFTPWFSKYNGERCGGVQLYIDPRSCSPLYASLVWLGPRIIKLLRDVYPLQFSVLPPWKAGGKRSLSLLYGNDSLADGLAPIADDSGEKTRLSRFDVLREPFLLYGSEDRE